MAVSTGERFLKTAEAAHYCTMLGRRTSASWLRRVRTAVATPDIGPPWVRDPGSGYVLYPETQLRAWVAVWHSRLSATHLPKAAHLTREAA